MLFSITILLLIFFLPQLNSQQSVFLETEDGWKIHLKYKKPKREDYPLLFLVHSQKENHTEWKNWFELIESFGYGWASIDLRGHGVSIYRSDGSSQTYKSFSVSGNDNDYNKMIRDIDSAMVYLSSTGVKEDKIFIVGSNLGANVSAKYCVINKNIAGAVLIRPYSTINDIPIIGLLRNYGLRPLLIVNSENSIKAIRDTMLIYYLTKSKTTQNGTFVIINGNFTSPRDMPKSLIYRILHWINTPYLFEVIDISSKTLTEQGLQQINTSTQTLKNSYLIIEGE